jgi:hypothetical protein
MLALELFFSPESAIAKHSFLSPCSDRFYIYKIVFKCGIGIKYNMYTTFTKLNNVTVLKRYHKNRIQVGICGLKPPHNWL